MLAIHAAFTDINDNEFQDDGSLTRRMSSPFPGCMFYTLDSLVDSGSTPGKKQDVHTVGRRY